MINLKLNRGFSLIELLVCLVIVGILSSIAYPSYAHYMVKVHRIKAEQNLYALANDLEHYYQLNHSYQGVDLHALPTDKQLVDGHYDYEITELTPESYEISAIPLGSQAKNDAICGQLNLDQLGDQTIGGNTASQTCWST